MIYELYLVKVKLNEYYEYLDQKSFCSKVIVRAHTQAHTHRPIANRLHYLSQNGL